jgi:hypothetical protein
MLSAIPDNIFVLQNLKQMKTAGTILIVIGAVLMLITGFNMVTEKKVLDLGKIEINKKESHPITWSPIVGGALLIGGIILLIGSKKQSVNL